MAASSLDIIHPVATTSHSTSPRPLQPATSWSSFPPTNQRARASSSSSSSSSSSNHSQSSTHLTAAAPRARQYSRKPYLSSSDDVSTSSDGEDGHSSKVVIPPPAVTIGKGEWNSDSVVGDRRGRRATPTKKGKVRKDSERSKEGEGLFLGLGMRINSSGSGSALALAPRQSQSPIDGQFTSTSIPNTSTASSALPTTGPPPPKRPRKGVTGPRLTPARGKIRGLGAWGGMVSEREKARKEKEAEEDRMSEPVGAGGSGIGVGGTSGVLGDESATVAVGNIIVSDVTGSNGTLTTNNPIPTHPRTTKTTTKTAKSKPTLRGIKMVGKGIITKPVLIAPAPTSNHPIVMPGGNTTSSSTTAGNGERNGSDEMVDMQMDVGGMGSIESGASGSGGSGNGDIEGADAYGEVISARKLKREINDSVAEESSHIIETNGRTQKKRKVSEVGLVKSARLHRPPPLQSTSSVLEPPKTPGSGFGGPMVSPVVTGFPVHTADESTMNHLRSALKIREAQRQLIIARKNGMATPTESPGLGPPSATLPMSSSVGEALRSTAGTTSSTSASSVGQRRGEVARNKVAGLRVHTTGSEGVHLSIKSAPAHQTSPLLVTVDDTDSNPGPPPFTLEDGSQFRPAPSRSRPEGVNGSHGPPRLAHRVSQQGYAPPMPNGPSSSQHRGFQGYYPPHNGAMTAYPSLGGPGYSMQQQMPYGSGGGMMRPPPLSGRRSSIQGNHQVTFAHAPAPSPRLDDGSMQPPTQGPPPPSVDNNLSSYAHPSHTGQSPQTHLPLYPSSDPTTLQARFGPGRSPPSSTIRRDFAPQARNWHAPDTGVPMTGGNEGLNYPGGGAAAAVSSSSAARRSAFMDPFHNFYDALMDANQLRAELSASLKKANEVIQSQDTELARFRGVLQGFERKFETFERKMETMDDEHERRDVEMDEMRKRMEELEGMVKGGSEGDGDGEVEREDEEDGEGEDELDHDVGDGSRAMVMS